MRHLDSESQGATNLYTALKSMTREPLEARTDEAQARGCRAAARIMFLFALALTVITIVEAVMRAQG